MLRTTAVLLALAGVAHGEDGSKRLAVAVDETVEVQVGYMIGFICDDLKLIDASIVTRNDVNVFIVKGLAVGTTQCRVGTDPQRGTVLFDVIVKPKQRQKTK
jgi:hypothetical protein